MRFRFRLALAVAFACLLTPIRAPLARAELPNAAESVLAGQRTREQLSAFLSSGPDACLPIDSERSICAWRRIGNRVDAWQELADAIETSARVNVICVLPTSGATRAAGSCAAYRCRSDRDAFRLNNSSPRKRRMNGAAVSRRLAAREEAKAELSSATDLEALIALVGDLPEQCAGATGTSRVCNWRLASNTLGHGTVAAAFDLSFDKKLRMVCTIEADGRVSGASPCSAKVGN